MIFKFNGGNGAILCGKCRKIVYEGTRIPMNLWESIKTGDVSSLPDVYCDDCENAKTKE